MKWIFQGVVIAAVLLVQFGCRSTKDEALGADDGMPIGVSQADPSGAKPKKARGIFRRRDEPEVEQVGERLVFEGVEEPLAPVEEPVEDNLDPGRSSEDLDRDALRQAKVHYELGDYDLARPELKRIRESSPSYKEAERLRQIMEEELDELLKQREQ